MSERLIELLDDLSGFVVPAIGSSRDQGQIYPYWLYSPGCLPRDIGVHVWIHLKKPTSVLITWVLGLPVRHLITKDPLPHVPDALLQIMPKLNLQQSSTLLGFPWGVKLNHSIHLSLMWAVKPQGMLYILFSRLPREEIVTNWKYVYCATCHHYLRITCLSAPMYSDFEKV